MLRVIALANKDPNPPEPDGIYNDATARAVAVFQKRFSLPETGVADQETFEAIVSEYNRITELIAPAQSCVVLFPAALTVHPGQSHSHVYLAQAMLSALCNQFSEFQPVDVSGCLDAATAGNLRQVQRRSGLEETGCLDKPTWNRLCILYRAMFDRYHAPSQG